MTLHERPIVFSGEMVRALLAGNKTQTRRVCKPFLQTVYTDHPEWSNNDNIQCPYGNVGDRLWVKEALVEKHDSRNPLIEDLASVANYATDGALVIRRDAIDDVGCEDWLWQRPRLPAMFMPRWASRITLELTAVRVERVQDISAADIEAEGTPVNPMQQMSYRNDAYQRCHDFMWLWDSINNKRGYGWMSNPFVWVLAFKRVEER